MQSTTNYNLPTYETTDNPNLITGYNAAMGIIDVRMKANADAIAAIEGFDPDPTNDSDFTVANLSGAKVASNGIVYVPTQV